MHIGYEKLHDIVRGVGKPHWSVLLFIPERGCGILPESKMIRTVGHQRNGCFIAVLRQIYLRRLQGGNQLRPVVIGVHSSSDAD